MRKKVIWGLSALALVASTVLVYAAASYPSATKSFTTKTDGPGQTIFAAHINDLQDEVVAIENALLNGFAHLLKPLGDATYDLGTSSLRWRDLYVSRNVSAKVFAGVCQGRLTLTSGTPVTTADVTAATNIYFAPYAGPSCAFYDGSATWTLLAFTETTLALGTLTNDLPYDVFGYNNAGTLALEALAWTSKTARATALTTQDGVLVKTGVTTRRYLGTFHTTTATTTEDSATKRLLWNYYNRDVRPILYRTADNSWNYTTATIHQANGNAANQIAVVVGWAEAPLHLDLIVAADNTNASVNTAVLIGEDSTTTAASTMIGGIGASSTASATAYFNMHAMLDKKPAVGYHYYAWLEWSQAVGTTQWWGGTGAGWAGSVASSGITGWVKG